MTFRTDTPYGVIELPSLALISLETIRRIFSAGKAEQFWILIEELCPVSSLRVMDRMPNPELKQLFLEWEAYSQVKAGDLLEVARILNSVPQREALEADLIRQGLRLRDCPSEQFNWHDLKIVVRHLPRTSSWVAQAFPEQAGWTKEAMLLADQADALNWLVWSKSTDGSKNRNRPKPIPRPGVKGPKVKASNVKPSPLSVMKQRMAEIHGPDAFEVRTHKLKELFA